MTEPLTHDTIKDGWFCEKSQLWPGQTMSLQVSEILVHEKSRYHDILLFQSTEYGNVLVLDGIVQCTERDEFSYQEMIAHLPLNSHPLPKKVLVIGGGEGGILREIVKHECVEEVILCESDEAVLRLSKKYIPSLAVGFQHPKVKVIVVDGLEYVKQHPNEFDVVIVDFPKHTSSLDTSQFSILSLALKEEGILCSQCECIWLHLSSIKTQLANAKTVFPKVDWAYTCIPTFPSGQIGFLLCGKSAKASFKKPLRSLPNQASKCRYYSSDVHVAAFVLPQFAKNALFPSPLTS